jgi:putative MATE family efflux protein
MPLKPPQHPEQSLVSGSVMGHVLRMTPPMATAFLAMMAFNLADTWFVSKLGTQPLAAMGFTFPIVMVYHAISMGIGLGVSSCVSRAIGARDLHRVRHFATYSLLLTVVVMSCLTLLGCRLLPALLAHLGATAETARLAASYMRIWFLFAPIVAIPMVGNNAIRTTGNTLQPAIVMSTAAVLNAILDPIMIFGWGPVPALGIPGAALATGLSRLITVGWALWLMHYRCHLLTREWTGLRALLRVWGNVLHIAIPCAATNLLMPVTMGIVTRLIAGHGEFAVAATAAGQRIEQFMYLAPMAMGSTLVPIIGQNWGANRIDRVREVWVKTNWYGIGYAVFCVVLALALAEPVAHWFSNDPKVIQLIALYLRIILTGAIMQHPMVHTGFAFNAIRKPLHAALLTIIRLAVLAVPLAWCGSRLAGVRGIYGGIAIATWLSGALALVWFGRVVAAHRSDEEQRI